MQENVTDAQVNFSDYQVAGETNVPKQVENPLFYMIYAQKKWLNGYTDMVLDRYTGQIGTLRNRVESLVRMC